MDKATREIEDDMEAEIDGLGKAIELAGKTMCRLWNELVKARAEGFAAGQREIRERAARRLDQYAHFHGHHGAKLSRDIRALPIIEEPKEKANERGGEY